MAKSSADDAELRRACEAAIEDTKQQIILSIRVAKSRGIWGKSGKLGRGHMAKARVIAISDSRGQHGRAHPNWKEKLKGLQLCKSNQQELAVE